MAAPQLRLEVSLNLTGFRSEIQKLTNIAQSEFAPKINVKFNRQTLDTELNNLQRAIKRRTYRVEIGGNIDSFPRAIENIRKQLAALETQNKIEIPISVKNGVTQKEARKVRSSVYRSVMAEGGKILLPVGLKPVSQTVVDKFKTDLRQKLGSISVKVELGKKGGFASSPYGEAGLLEFMRTQGMIGKTADDMQMSMKNGGDDIKKDLNDAVQSAEKIKSIFDGVAKSIATTGKSIANVQGKRLGLANVPLVAGAMEKRIERSASAIEGTTSSDALKALYPDINKTIVSLAALRGQVQQNTSKLSGFSLIIGLAAFAGVPLAKSIVKLTGSADKFSKLLDELGPRLEAALTKAASNILNATSSRLLSGGSVAGLLSAGSVAGLLPPAYRGIGPSAEPAGLLPPAYRGIGPSAKPAGLLPSLSSAGRSNAIIKALIASTGPRLLPSGGGDDSLGKLAAPRQTKDAVDAILRNYFKVVEAQIKEVFSAPPIKKESLNIFDHLNTEQYFNYLAQARINAENAIKQRIEEAKQVTKQNQIKDAAQSFLRALEETVRNAERSVFTQSRIAANRSYVQRANIREVGQPLLGGMQVAPPKMLSAATGFYRGASTSPLVETQAQLFARREREARMRSALRGVDVMGGTPTRAPARYSYANRPAMPRRPTSAIVPYEAGGALVPSGGGGGGAPPVPPRGGGGGGGAFGGMQFNMPQLPGAGLVREIGSEFAMATKQVLLFGTAYKALAFLQSFPAQVGDAVGALQSFRNTIGEISPSAKEAAESSQFILDIVDKYNTPLQSARDGFVKLYASMQPAGFSGDEIRDLFLGISQTAATFGMSADKVDRVNYAFAQMASKGQVMSEELKGQLGDVLPGAMAIFAEAAGFKGPEAITKFSKALEDGAYKGAAMKTLLTNVGLIMRKEFGPGAEGAARTFQGVINRMQNSLALLYESFEPVAIGFLNSVVMPLTSGIKTVTDGFKAFFTGQAAQTAGGSVFAKQLEALRPAFEGIAANIKQILPLLQSFASTALSLGQALLQIAGNPFVGYLARIYLSVLPLTMALRVLNLQVLIPLIGSFLRAIPAFISFNAAMMSGVGTNRALIATMQLTGQTAGVTAGRIRLVSAALATLGSTAILAGIGLLVERFLMMKGAIDGVRQSTQQMLGSISGMANSGAVKELKNVGQDLQKQRGTFEELRSFVSGGAIAGGKERLTEAGAKKFEEVGMGSFVKKDVFGKPYIADSLRASEIIEEKLKGLDKQSAKVQEKLPLAAKVAADLAKQAQAAQVIAPIPEAPGDGNGKQSLESYYSLQDQLAKAQTQADIDRLEAAFEHARALVNAEYDLKEAKANSFQKKAIAFQKEIFAITSEQDAALFQNRNKVLAAAGSVAGGAGGGAPVASSGYIDKSVLRTFLQSQGFGRTTGDYTNEGHATPNHTLNAMDMGILGGSDADALRRTIAMERQLKATGAFGNQLFGPERDPYGHGAGKGGQNIHLHIPTPGGKVKMTPGLADLMNYSGPASPGATPGKIAPSVKRNELAEQQVTLTAREASAANIEKEAEAIAKLEIATANYVQSLVPTAEQALQNQLLQQRITLTQNSFSPEILEAQLAFAEQELQVAENITKNTEEINRLTTASGNNTKLINALTDANNQLKANLPVSAIQLLTKAIDDQVLSLVQRTKTAKQDAADQERVNSLIIGGMTRQAAEAKVTAENLRSDYKKALEEATRQVEIAAAAEEVLAAARRLGKKETAEQTAEYNRLAKALKDAKDKKDALEGRAPQVEGAATGVEGSAAPKTTSSYIADGLSAAQEKLDQLTNTGYQVVQAANAIGEAFGTAFKGVITGSMTAREALAGMFQSVADHFADMVAQMIAEYLKMALIKGIMSIIGSVAGGLGGGLSGAFGASGPSFNAGAFSGPALSPGAAFGGAGAESFSGAFSGGAAAFNPAAFSIPAFANGGIVTGPTLGLVGEGRYNEAVIPLPDGKSVPVQLSGGDGGSQINSNITVNVSNGQAQSNATGSNSSELGRKIEGAVKQVIVGELRPGGLLASR